MVKPKKMSMSEFFADTAPAADHPSTTVHRSHDLYRSRATHDGHFGGGTRRGTHSDNDSQWRQEPNRNHGTPYSGGLDRATQTDSDKKGVRPRLNLSRRKDANGDVKSDGTMDTSLTPVPSSSSNPKPNPFGSATAVDIAVDTTPTHTSINTPKLNPFGSATAVDIAIDTTPDPTSINPPKPNPFGSATAVDIAIDTTPDPSTTTTPNPLEWVTSVHTSAQKPMSPSSMTTHSPAPNSLKHPKPNPFGSATAVDNAAKIRELELKDNERKVNMKENEGHQCMEKEETQGVPDRFHWKDDTEDDAKQTVVTEAIGESKSTDSRDSHNHKKERRQRRRREPKVVNSRAALLGEASARERQLDSKEELSHRRDREPRDRDRYDRHNPTPLTVVNERVAKLAEEEKELQQRQREEQSNRDHETHDQDPRERRHHDHIPPTPVSANSRFAKAIEADPSYSTYVNHFDGGEGPPLVIQNTRFTAAIEADSDRKDAMVMDLGPPPVCQNSRFALAAQAIQEDQNKDRDWKNEPTNENERELREDYSNNTSNTSWDRYKSMKDRGSGYNDHHGNDRDDRYTNPTNETRRFANVNLGPPPNNHSRFASVAAEHDVQREQERGSTRFGRASGDVRMVDTEQEKGSRFFGDDHYGGDRRHGEGAHYNRGNRNEIRGGTNRHGYSNRPSIFSEEHNKTVLIAPTLPDHLQPKKKPEPIFHLVQAPLALPGEDEEAARERMERRKKDEEEKLQAEEKAKQLENKRKIAEETCNKEKSVRAAELEVDMLKTFGGGKIIGTELVRWCVDQGSLLPSVDKLVWSVLEKWVDTLPDLECPWAKPENFGAAMLSLVEDHTSRQVQILWGIQKYCQVQEFPKIKDEYLVQAMFRAMYKYDLASLEAFAEWKEDDSEEHSEGKMKAIIQTVDWFNWLEEEDEEEYEEKEYDDTYDVDGELEMYV